MQNCPAALQTVVRLPASARREFQLLHSLGHWGLPVPSGQPSRWAQVGSLFVSLHPWLKAALRACLNFHHSSMPGVRLAVRTVLQPEGTLRKEPLAFTEGMGTTRVYTVAMRLDFSTRAHGQNCRLHRFTQRELCVGFPVGFLEEVGWEGQRMFKRRRGEGKALLGGRTGASI